MFSFSIMPIPNDALREVHILGGVSESIRAILLEPGRSINGLSSKSVATGGN